MSQHADLTKWMVVTLIKTNLNGQAALDSYENLMDAAGYDEEFSHPKHLIDTANYMLTQKEKLYGVSHAQLKEWIEVNKEFNL